jgi:putative toxin-antitoxin system antitoxin component (TIGR02293 family)
VPTYGRELAERVRAGFPFNTIQQLAGLSGFSPAELAGIIKIPQRTLQRRRESGVFSATESDRLYRLSTIVAAALDLFQGNAEHARKWLCKPLRYLHDRRPIDMIETGVETELMLTYILQLEHGITP